MKQKWEQRKAKEQNEGTLPSNLVDYILVQHLCCITKLYNLDYIPRKHILDMCHHSYTDKVPSLENLQLNMRKFEMFMAINIRCGKYFRVL